MTGPVDLLVRSGRLFDAALGLDGSGAVAITADRIVAAGPDVDAPAGRVVDLGDAVLLPGLVDLHGHPDRRPVGEGSKYGVDPDVEFLPRGVTTVLFGLIAVTGARIWVENRVDFTRGANLFVAAVALIVGAADYTLTLGPIVLNGIALGTFGAILLHLLFGDGARGTAPAAGSADAAVAPRGVDR